MDIFHRCQVICFIFGVYSLLRHCVVGSQDCYATRPVKSPAEYNETLAEEVEGDSKDELRRGVESLFNTLYGMRVTYVYM